MDLVNTLVDLTSRSLDLGLGGRGAHLAIPSLLGPVLASVLVFNRVYWRIAIVHTVGLDDMCVMLSLVGRSRINVYRGSTNTLYRFFSSLTAWSIWLLWIMGLVAQPRLYPQ